MFEYLMPALWMTHHRHTIMQDSMEAVVRIQQKVARSRRIPWGISESASSAKTAKTTAITRLDCGACDEASRFGSAGCVALFYFLALPLDPKPQLRICGSSRSSVGSAVMDSTKRSITGMESGSHQVMDGAPSRHEPALGLQFLFDDPMQQYFHAEPQVLATELLFTNGYRASSRSSGRNLPLPRPLSRRRLLIGSGRLQFEC